MHKLVFVLVLATACSKIIGIDDVELRDAGPADPVDADADADAAPAAPAQRAYLKASNTGAEDRFGSRIALSADGSTLAVGAPREDSSASGINDNQDDDGATNAGAVYVFVRSGATWLQQAYLKASNTSPGDNFGESVALSANGSTLAVGAPYEDSKATGVDDTQADESAPQAGAVYTFSRSGTVWSQRSYLKGSNTGPGDFFGWSVSLSSDGLLLAVGAPGEAGGATGVDPQSNEYSPAAGAVYVFSRTSTSWAQQAYVKASNTDAADQFGAHVMLSADGSTLAVGAIAERSKATDVGGDQADNSRPDAGAVYVFTRSSTLWTQQAYIKSSHTEQDRYFGINIALSSGGSTLAAGALRGPLFAIGAVHVFTRSGTAWTPQSEIPGASTGMSEAFDPKDSIALSGDGSTLLIGTLTADASGAVQIFARRGATWDHQVDLQASNRDAKDAFGDSVAMAADGSIIAVGASGEDSAAKGIGNDQDDNSAERAGAVYVFH